MPGARIKLALGLVLVVALGCATTEPSGKRVLQSSRTRGAQNKQKTVAAKKAAIDPRLARERELFAILAGKKVRSLPAQEQALAAALAMKEIAELRDQRGDAAGAEEAIERAVREAQASGEPTFVTGLLRERFRIYRAHALAAADRGDFASSLKQLDKISLFSENTADERKTIVGDRFLINDRRDEQARQATASKALPMPGEEQLDTKAVLAEADRVFSALSSFEAPPPEESAGQAFLDQLSFELNATTGADATMDIVPLPQSTYESGAEKKSATRGHELASNDRLTVDLGTNTLPASVIGRQSKQEAQVLLERNDAPVLETGRFDTRTVAALVSLNKRSVARCYDRSLRAGERLTGKMEVRITVQPNGTVSAAKVGEEKLSATEMGRCVAQTLARWRFPPFDGPEAQVTIPFFLKGSF